MLLHTLRAFGALLLHVSRAHAILPIALWSGLIYVLSSLSARGLGTIGRVTFLSNLGHAPLFGLLGLWFALALPREAAGRSSGWPRLDRAGRGTVFLAVAIWSIADELHQGHAGRGRDFSLLDVVTGLVGAVAVLAVIDYAGRDGASERGLWARLGLGGLASALAAALATWLPPVLGGLGGAAWL